MPDEAATAEEQAVANRRARKLLYDYLTPFQRDMFDQVHSFYVTARGSGNRYVVDGCAVYSEDMNRHYCLQALSKGGKYLPTCDQILARALLIELDEPRFLKVAVAMEWAVEPTEGTFARLPFAAKVKGVVLVSMVCAIAIAGVAGIFGMVLMGLHALGVM